MSVITSTSISASWHLPPVGSRNGNITGFKLYFKEKESNDSTTIVLTIDNASILTKTAFDITSILVGTAPVSQRSILAWIPFKPEFVRASDEDNWDDLFVINSDFVELLTGLMNQWKTAELMIGRMIAPLVGRLIER